MPTIFEEAFLDMAATLDQVAGFAVTLSRKVGGIVVTCDVTGVLGRTIFSRTRTGNTSPSIEFGDGDWFIRATDYKLGPAGPLGEAVEPEDGDRIADTVTGRLFEIRPIVGEPSWRWSEPEKLTYRIHTTEIQEDGP